MKTYRRPRLAVLVVLSLGACASLKEESPSVGAASHLGDRSVTTTVTVSYRVDRVRAATQRIRSLVTENRGYVESADTAGGDADSAHFNVRVPAPSLPAFRGGIRHLGELDYENERAEDVTRQQSDLEARIRNARKQEERLLQVLAQSTGRLEDILALEKELGRIREAIEVMQAQEAGLAHHVAYALVSISIAPKDAAFLDNPGAAIARAAGNGIKAAWSIVLGAIMLAASAGPSLVVVAIGCFLVFTPARFLFRRRRARMA